MTTRVIILWYVDVGSLSKSVSAMCFLLEILSILKGVVGWYDFPCRSVLLILIILGQGPTALAVGVGGGCFDLFFSLIYHFSFISPSFWETARYRLKYCL